MILSEELRQTVLQAAIEGKLTNQLPSDSPVKVLINKINAAREKMIELKKVKKKKLTAIDESEIPFNIPDSWTWVRLNSIYNFIDYRGKTPNKINSGIVLLTASNIKKGYLDFTQKDFISQNEFEERKSRGITKKGDIIFTTEAPLGNVAICNLDTCSCGQRIITFQSYEGTSLSNELYKYFLLSPYFQNQLLDKQSGTTAKGIKAERLKTLLIPLPPIEEQYRIVDKIDRIMKEIDEFESIEQQLASLKNDFPINMRNSLLQAAMQGKLTKQLETDSSVDDLLESINVERDKLISNKNYKVDKKLRPLDDTEIPFDIPENWRWIKLGYCSTYGQTKSKASVEETESSIWSLDLEDIEKITGRLLRRVKASDRTISGDKLRFQKGNILYSKLRPYLLKMLIADDDGICTPELIPFSMIGNINSNYILWSLRSPHIDYTINSVTYGVKMPRVGADTMLNLLIPLPPIEEQQRIVEQLNKLIPLCDEL